MVYSRTLDFFWIARGFNSDNNSMIYILERFLGCCSKLLTSGIIPMQILGIIFHKFQTRDLAYIILYIMFQILYDYI